MSKKIIKAKIEKVRTANQTQFTYPNCWDANKVHVIAYEDTAQLGNIIEYCIGIVDETDLSAFLISSDIVEIDVDEANILVNLWQDPSIVQIVDSHAVVQALLTDEVNRTDQHKKILNPDDSTLGLNRKRVIDINEFL